jgi:hypothetical protein
MEPQNTQPGKIVKWVCLGAAAGALFLAFDGAVIGAIVGSLDQGAGPLEGALRWAEYFAVAGLILGAAVGGIARLMGPRMVLEPPTKEDER